MSAARAERILLILLGGVREFVRAAPAMAQIRQTHPAAQITLLTTAPFQGLARGSPWFNTVDAEGETNGFAERMALIGRLRAMGLRRVYDLQGSAASRMITSGVGFLGPKVSGAPRMDYPPPDLSWIVNSAPAERQLLRGPDRRAYALLIPGAAETPDPYQWPSDRYAEIGRLLQKRGLDIFIAGGPKDSAVARTIQHKTPGARDMTGVTDFGRIALLAARAEVVIGADCGLLHLAAATGAPTVVIYGVAVDPANIAPRGHVAVLHADNLNDLKAESVVHAVELLSPAGARSA